MWLFLFVGLASANGDNCITSVLPHPTTLKTGTDIAVLSQPFSFSLAGGETPPPVLARAFARYKSLIFKHDSGSSSSGSSNFGARLAQLTISLESSDHHLSPDINETYTLSVDSGAAALAAATVTGVLRGLETFSQLVLSSSSTQCSAVKQGAFVIPNVPIAITDSPRFPHRGLLLDTSRSFFPITDIKRQLDGMSFVKMNVFHWHITDSQSFPIESKTYPDLSGKGAYSSSQTYSPSDVTAVVEYAKDRGIRVVPEFDTPGHTTSWGKAFPDIVVCPNKQPWSSYCNEPPCGQLDPTNNQTYDVMSGLFAEMAALFPDPYFHLGSDEVNFNCWESDAGIQKYMKDNNKTANNLLQDFEARVQAIVGPLNKTVLHWEEVITSFKLDIPKDNVIQVWLGESSVKPITEQGYKVVASPYQAWYLDCGTGSWITGGKSWCDPYKTWTDVYSYDPTAGLSAAQASLVIGGEVALWSETIDRSNVDTKAWPRTAAAAERLWSSAPSISTPAAALPRMLSMRELLVVRGLSATPIQPQWCRINPGYCD